MFSNRSLFAAAPLAVAASLAQAQISDGVVKIGVLSDMSSLYSDIGGGGSVVAARMAIADFPTKGMKVELLSADHLNKPDVGSSIARQWYDVDKVDVIVDVPTSSIALAISQITREKGKAFLVSGAATSDLTGKACSPNTINWTYVTWMLANGTGNAIVKTGGDSWYFITAVDVMAPADAGVAPWRPASAPVVFVRNSLRLICFITIPSTFSFRSFRFLSF